MVSPPPGVSSGSAFRPSPRSGRGTGRARARRRWCCRCRRGAGTARRSGPCRVGRDAGAVVHDPDLDPVAQGAGGDRAAGVPGGLYRSGVGDRGWPRPVPAGRRRRDQSGRSSGRSSATSRPPGPRSSSASGHDLVERDRPDERRRARRPAAGSCRAGSRPAGSAGPATRRRSPAARPRSCGVQVDLVGCAGCRRPPWLTASGRAQVVADGGEQGGAHAVGLDRAVALFGLLGRAAGVPAPTAACAANALSTRRSSGRAAGPAAARVTVVADRHLDVGLAGRGRGRLPDRGGDLPAGVVELAGRAFEQAHRGQPERLPELVEQGGQRVSRPAARCRPGWRAWPPRAAARAACRVRRAARSTTALTASGDDDEDQEREHVVPLGDGEGVQRRREVLVEQQAGGDGGGQRRAEAADQRDRRPRASR